jgi:ferredoxin-NADP reductase
MEGAAVPFLVLPALEVIPATPRTRIIRLALNHQPFSFAAGQAVIVGLHYGTVRKPYSIASSPRQAAAADAIELLAQVDDADPLDPHLERVSPGTLVDVDGPFGHFRLPNPIVAGEMLLIAGGTGIAPLRSMLGEALAPRLVERIAVIYSARKPEELAYREELEQLARSGALELYMTVTRADHPSWSGLRGRLDERLIASALKTPQTHCLICGPPGFVSDATSLLLRAGVPDPLIASERYA